MVLRKASRGTRKALKYLSEAHRGYGKPLSTSERLLHVAKEHLQSLTGAQVWPPSWVWSFHLVKPGVPNLHYNHIYNPLDLYSVSDFQVILTCIFTNAIV